MAGEAKCVICGKPCDSGEAWVSVKKGGEIVVAHVKHAGVEDLAFNQALEEAKGKTV